MTLAGVEITVSGIVQGVGFRYFIYRRARSLNLVGWVRNNRDGTVSVAAEGDREMLEGLLDVLREGPPGASIRDMSIDWQDYRGQFKAFDIIH